MADIGVDGAGGPCCRDWCRGIWDLNLAVPPDDGGHKDAERQTL